MKLIELHILQSYPVSCLNRDDVGAPKTAVFGGAPRARISSQSLKRAIRTLAREQGPEGRFEGVRSRYLQEPFMEALQNAGLDEAAAKEKTKLLIETFSKQDSKHKDQVTTAVFLSPGEIQQIAEAVAAGTDPKKAAKKTDRLDAADIALFGRMVANDATLNIEGAAMFSHALSVHRAVNDIDFFSAVDDRKDDAEDAGAGMIGTLEFTSATYYRYMGLNLDLLTSESHLGKLEPDARKSIAAAFLRSTLEAVPGARQNTMNAHTRPHAVLGIAKESGQPLQLINAFEQPVLAKRQEGFATPARQAMEEHYAQMKKTWGLDAAAEVWLPDAPLNAFLQPLLDHV